MPSGFREERVAEVGGKRRREKPGGSGVLRRTCCQLRAQQVEWKGAYPATQAEDGPSGFSSMVEIKPRTRASETVSCWTVCCVLIVSFQAASVEDGRVSCGARRDATDRFSMAVAGRSGAESLGVKDGDEEEAECNFRPGFVARLRGE